MDRAALIIVDCQNDFLPSGSLAVEDGDQVLEPIKSLLSDQWKWGIVVASQDYHPEGHISFASRHGGRPFETKELAKPNGVEYTQTLWPDHCVQGSKGAEIEKGLRDALGDYHGEKLLSRKGYDLDVEAYSAFTGYLSELHSPKTPPPPIRPFDDSPASISNGELAQALRKRGIDRVIVVGLALDVCVGATAMDSVRCGFKTGLLRPATRGVNADRCEKVQGGFIKEGGVVLGEKDSNDWQAELRSWLA